MTILPNANAARVDIAKLREYCLNPESPDGQHKARVFRSALGITTDDADWLREEILRAVRSVEAVRKKSDAHGTRFRVDLTITRHGRSAMVSTGWIVEPNEIAPRLTTCWVV